MCRRQSAERPSEEGTQCGVRINGMVRNRTRAKEKLQPGEQRDARETRGGAMGKCGTKSDHIVDWERPCKQGDMGLTMTEDTTVCALFGYFPIPSVLLAGQWHVCTRQNPPPFPELEKHDTGREGVSSR